MIGGLGLCWRLVGLGCLYIITNMLSIIWVWLIRVVGVMAHWVAINLVEGYELYRPMTAWYLVCAHTYKSKWCCRNWTWNLNQRFQAVAGNLKCWWVQSTWYVRQIPQELLVQNIWNNPNCFAGFCPSTWWAKWIFQDARFGQAHARAACQGGSWRS